MKALKNFLLYNNTIPLVFGLLFLGAGATFAASPDAREAVYSESEVVEGVDNSVILSASVTTYPIAAVVDSIEEDDFSYFVTYLLDTLDVEEGVWQSVTHTRILEVRKESIAGGDLGVYVSEQLAQIYDAERRRLIETKEIERKIGRTARTVTTKYSGLVGRALNDNTREIGGYNPLFAEPGATTQNPLTEAEIREQQKEQARQQREKEKALKVGNETVVVQNQTGDNGGGQDNPPPPNPTATTTPPVNPPATTIPSVQQNPPEPEPEPEPETTPVPPPPENVATTSL